MNYDNKKKGDIGFGHAISEIISQGWNVCIPLTENISYDLIAEKDGVCKRVQVRYTTMRDDFIQVKVSTPYKDREKSDCDVLAVYCPDTGDVYFLESDKFDNSANITLRVKEPGKMSDRVKLAENYKKFC